MFVIFLIFFVNILLSFWVRVINDVALEENGEVVISVVTEVILVGLIEEVLSEVIVVVVVEKLDENDSQSPTLQISVLVKSRDVTSLQYEIQDRTLVLFPLPHVLLQNDHWPHEAYSEGPKKTILIFLPI